MINVWLVFHFCSSSVPALSFPDDQGHCALDAALHASCITSRVTHAIATGDHLKETLSALEASVRCLRGGADPSLALNDLQEEASSGFFTPILQAKFGFIRRTRRSSDGRTTGVASTLQHLISFSRSSSSSCVSPLQLVRNLCAEVVRRLRVTEAAAAQMLRSFRSVGAEQEDKIRCVVTSHFRDCAV